jgi:IstB-like ATP binding protein
MELVTLVQKTETCRSCARPMPVATVRVTLGNRTLTLRATVCRACADASQSFGAPCKSEWQRLCPPHYQRDLPPAIIAQAWVGDVLGWQYKPQGLLVVGDTGAGKTWVMWRLLRRLLEERRSVVVLDAVTYRSGLSRAAREGETEYYVRRLARADVLYWDDFGQTHLSAAASEMLLHVVEQRTSYQRPMLVTSQYKGTALELQFERPEMGAAVRRRVNEFCRVVITGESTRI